MFRPLVINSVSILLIGLLLPACSSAAPMDEPDDGTLYACHLNNCDIDIRPAGRNETPEQRLTVDYAVYDADGQVPAQQVLTLTPWYSRDDVARMRVTDASAQKTFLVKLTRTQVLQVVWDDVANKKAVVKVNGRDFDVDAVGTYDAAERIASPAFELEDPPIQGAAEEKVRIRCHYKGLRVSLIVMKS